MHPLAAVVITYHPSDDFYNHLETYITQVDRLFVVDNSEPKFQFNGELLANPKIILINNGANEGIAARLNQVAHQAVKEGYQWLLTMDQDSFFETEHLSAYFEYVMDYPGADQVAMFGVETNQAPEIIADLTEPVDRLITSGSLVNLQLFAEVGDFDEKLFIDEVDHEYCYRASLKGYKIIQFTHIYLHHRLGEDVIVRTLKGRRKQTAFHSPLRLYYMLRNYLYLTAKYKPAFEKDLKFRGKGLLHRIKNNLLYGPDKLVLLKMLYSAYRDYKTGRMGKKVA
ncbi:MAG TPA: glycosyltransferase [Arachidicoccus sp.]|nr:glycosyltransferase [Arachidicoccus sp.]